MTSLLSRFNALKHVAYYAIGLCMMKGVSLVMLPFLAHSLSPSEIGKLELLTTVSALFGLVINFAMHEVLFRFVNDNEPEKRKVTASQIYFLSLIIAACALPILLAASFFVQPFSENIYQKELLTLIVGLSIEGAIGIGLAWLRMQNRAGLFVIVTVSTCLIQVLFILLSLKHNIGVVGILLSSVTAHAIQLVLLHKMNQFNYVLPTLKQISQYLQYGFPIAMSGVLAFGLNGADKLLLNAATDFEQLAIYAISTKFALAMCILVQPFGMWWMPNRFHFLHHHGSTAFGKVVQYGIIWIVFLTVCITYSAPLFIHYFLPESYMAAAKYVVLTLAIALLKEISELTNIGILLKKQTGLLLKINIIATAIAISLAFYLMSYSTWGILISLFIAQLFRLVCITVCSQKLYTVRYSIVPVLLLMLLSTSHLIISYYISENLHYILMLFLAPISVILLSVLTGLLPITSILSHSKYSERMDPL